MDGAETDSWCDPLFENSPIFYLQSVWPSDKRFYLFSERIPFLFPIFSFQAQCYYQKPSFINKLVFEKFIINLPKYDRFESFEIIGVFGVDIGRRLQLYFLEIVDLVLNDCQIVEQLEIWAFCCVVKREFSFSV